MSFPSLAVGFDARVDRWARRCVPSERKAERFLVLRCRRSRNRVTDQRVNDMVEDGPDAAERGERRKPTRAIKPARSWAFATLNGALDWARDPVAFVALSVACVFLVALCVAAATNGGLGERGGAKTHVFGLHGRAATRRASGVAGVGDARVADATKRWAALRVPPSCLRGEYSPAAVIPGLELHELDGEPAFYLTRKEETTLRERTEDEKEETSEVREELDEAKEEMKDAEKTLESEIATEEEELKIIEGKDALPSVDDESSTAGGGRRLLDDDDDKEDKEDEDERYGKLKARSTIIRKDGKIVRRFRFANPLLIDGVSEIKDWRRAPTEKQLLLHIANITGYDARCQFKTMQCANMASDLLARALKADAEAVVNPSASAETLKQLSSTLIKYTNDPRTKLNATDLPSLGGTPQAMGSCAWTTEAEYNPQSGARYDQTVSRFASAIDHHDTAVYCSVLSEHKYCKFTNLKTSEMVTVELDEQSYEKARAVGRLVHDSLSADVELGSNVVGWGYRGDPSPAFVALVMLLRSNRCSRVDVYGQPGVPIDWYHNARGYAHMVAVPGTSSRDAELSRVLLQEKYFYRTLMSFGKMCFYK